MTLMQKYSTYILLIVMISILALVFISLKPHPLSASIPTGGAGTKSGGAGTESTSDPSKYLNNLYRWFLGAVGISALFAIVLGGVLYMFSGTSLTKTENARRWNSNGIWGIVLAAISFLLLYTINPDLVTHGFDLNKVIENALLPPR